MIPLILLALGLGAALTVYELSPRARSRVDAYARAIRSANVAHQTADAHLATAARHAQQASIAKQAAQPPPYVPWGQPPYVPWGQPPYVPWGQPPYVPWMPMQPAPMQPTPMQPTPMQPTPMQPAPMQPTPMQPPPTPTPPTPTEAVPVPTAPMPTPPVVPPAPSPPPAPAQDIADAQTDVAVDHTVAANEANQDAAKNTADAAQNAQTDAEKQAAADSAAKVLARERQIAEALRTLGVGQCGVRTYPRVTERAKTALLAKLRTEGMGVTGDNPWNIDTRQYNVKLRAVWDPKASVVKLIVTTGRGGLAGLVTCEEIWKKIDPIMKEVIR